MHGLSHKRQKIAPQLLWKANRNSNTIWRWAVLV